MNRRHFIAATGAAVIAGCSDSKTCANGSGETCDPNERSWEKKVEAEIHTRVNQIREDNGCDTLSYNDTLAQVARDHSADMIERDYFDHDNPDGEGPSDRISGALTCSATGENIAMNHESDSSVSAAAKATVNQWMDSSGHRENILTKRWTEEGIGVAVAGNGEVYYTQNFGENCNE